MGIFNFSTRKVGGLRFVKLGRLTLSFSVSREYKPMADNSVYSKRAALLKYRMVCACQFNQQ
jgi:hypothetical protein